MVEGVCVCANNRRGQRGGVSFDLLSLQEGQGRSHSPGEKPLATSAAWLRQMGRGKGARVINGYKSVCLGAS